VSKVWAGLVVLFAACVASSAVAAPRCTQGEYYIRALGGYVLVPARFTPYSFDLEEGTTGAYGGPPFPMVMACASEHILLEAGNIETGSTEAMMTPGRLPRIEPTMRTEIAGFTVTVWRSSTPGDSAKERTIALIVKERHALRVFDADPDLWRRILDSFEEL
jgi:hypothetical protein